MAGEIKRHFRDKGTAIRFPRRLQELHQSVVRVNEQMKNELGREPTVAELAERLGVTPDDVTEAIEMGPAYMPLSWTSRSGRATARTAGRSPTRSAAPTPSSTESRCATCSTARWST